MKVALIEEEGVLGIIVKEYQGEAKIRWWQDSLMTEGFYYTEEYLVMDNDFEVENLD